MTRHRCLECRKYVQDGEELTLGIHQHCVPGYIAQQRLTIRELRARAKGLQAASNADLERRRAAERRRSADGIREPVLCFAWDMELKLRKNDHKPHWSGASVRYLFSRLLEETTELDEELELLGDGAEEDAQDECVDVANMAMMLWDRIRLPPGGTATDEGE